VPLREPRLILQSGARHEDNSKPIGPAPPDLI
jgi:hypothetical protein